MMTLRSKADVDVIRERVIKGSTLLIVGAGYIGLEVAASAVKRGVKVIVLEAQERVLARVTSPVVSKFYQNLHAEHDVSIELRVGIHRFDHESASTVTLTDGRTLTFDNAIIGIGVVPNVELAEAAGLVCDNGVVVDEFTLTSDPNVYAIGDCCNHPSKAYQRRLRLESVPNAVEQARIAAQAICGKPEPYDSIPWFWSDQYDVKLQTVGLFNGYDQAMVRGSVEDKKFAVFYVAEGRLLAVDALNSPIDFMLGKKLIASDQDYSAVDFSDPTLDLKSLL